jgi:uncharacterized protein
MHPGRASALLPALLVGLLAAGVALAGLAVPPPPSRRVNDYAGILSAGDRERLEHKLAEREGPTSNQVVVAIFRSLEGENLEDYSIRLAQAWRVGQKSLDNGVIFLVFLDDRKMRIEVGYGLEATLTDATAGSIIRDVVAPRFRDKRYAEGVEAGLDAIGQAIAGTYQRPAQRPAASPARRVDPGPWLPLAVFGLVAGVGLVSAIVNAQQSRQRGWTGGRRGWTGGPTWSASGSSWSSSSSSSSDSFSSGGGSFGGGGASGEW